MEQEFGHYYPLRHGRVHEVYGAGACAFATSLCACQKDAVIWIYNGHETSLYHAGFAQFGTMENIYFLHVSDAKTQAWCMEETLGSASVGLVICERNQAVNFRDMRRLQLAAERGQTTGLFITSERFVSPAAETRWLCEPFYDDQDTEVKTTLQNWSLVKNKQGALGQWKVRWDEETHRFSVV